MTLVLRAWRGTWAWRAIGATSRGVGVKPPSALAPRAAALLSPQAKPKRDARATPCRGRPPRRRERAGACVASAAGPSWKRHGQSQTETRSQPARAPEGLLAD